MSRACAMFWNQVPQLDRRLPSRKGPKLGWNTRPRWERASPSGCSSASSITTGEMVCIHSVGSLDEVGLPLLPDDPNDWSDEEWLAWLEAGDAAEREGAESGN